MNPDNRIPQRNMRTETHPGISFGRRRISWGVLVLSWLLLLAVGAAGYFYYELKYAAQIEKEKEIEDLTGTIGEFIELPTNETPTLATVTDREKLADQTFFLNAENGDKVLIYSQSGKAILYRPSTKKVIDMTTVNVNTPTETETSAGTGTQTPIILRVALRNGSTDEGKINAAETQVKALVPNVAITSKEEANSQTYQNTIVVDITGLNSENAEKIAAELGGSVGNLPAGEEAISDADIMVIVGAGSQTPGE